MIKPNSILLEPSTFLSPLIAIENKEPFSLKDFYNLSNFIESLILHDEAFTFGVNRKYYAIPLIKKLKKEHLLSFFVEDMYAYRKPLQDFYSPEVQNDENEYDLKNTYYQEYSLGISNNHGLPYVPSIENTKTVLELNKISQSEHLQSNISKHYKKLERTFFQDLDTLKEFGKPIKLFIPPIMAIVLSKSSSINDFFNVIFDIRQQYKPLRDKFRDYEFALKDDNTTLLESVKAAKMLKYELEILTNNLESRDNRMALELCDFFKELPGELFDVKKDLSPDKIIKLILGKPFEWIKNTYMKRKISYFLSIKNKTYNINRYNELVKKVFGFNYSKMEIEQFNSRFREIIY